MGIEAPFILTLGTGRMCPVKFVSRQLSQGKAHPPPTGMLCEIEPSKHGRVETAVAFVLSSCEVFQFLQTKLYVTNRLYCIVLYCIVLYCIVVGSRRLMPPDALQPKAYCTNPGL